MIQWLLSNILPLNGIIVFHYIIFVVSHNTAQIIMYSLIVFLNFPPMQYFAFEQIEFCFTFKM